MHETGHLIKKRSRLSMMKMQNIASLLMLAIFFSGCTLKLSTDLSRLLGSQNPRELMGSSEAQQIATRIGEGMGTKIMEGEVLAEDMGKGLGEVLVRPKHMAVLTDPVSVGLVEKSGVEAIREGKWDDAVDAFKRTNNLAKLEEIALILFDRGNLADAADLHHYLIEHSWPLRPAYAVARRIEQQGLSEIRNAQLKAIEPARYNAQYAGKSYSILDTISLTEEYVRRNTLTKAEMINRLKGAPVIILADTYFDTGQHGTFYDIIIALYHADLTIGLEEGLFRLKYNRPAAEQLNYLPLLTFIEEKGISTFTHGPSPATAEQNGKEGIDFFAWDSSLAATVSNLTGRGKQVLLIIGSTHASTDHLPFLIEEKSGIDPVLVVQSPLGLRVDKLFETHGALCDKLAAWGAGQDTALAIENDFFLNTPLSHDDFNRYLALFDLQPRLLTP